MGEQGKGMQIVKTEELARVGDKPFSRVCGRLVPTGVEWNELALISCGPTAAALLVDYDRGLLGFVRQGRVGADGDYVTEVPAGAVDRGEDAWTAARREVEEETGFVPTHLELVAEELLVSPGYTTERKSLFIASGLQAGEKREEDAHIEPVWELIESLDALIETASRRGDLTTYTLLLALWRHLRLNGALSSSDPVQATEPR